RDLHSFPTRRSSDLATMFTVPLLVIGMQKTVPSMAACGAPSVRLPAHMPVSVMQRVAGLPKAPACVWPVQKTPVALVKLALPVVRVFSATLSAPLKSREVARPRDRGHRSAERGNSPRPRRRLGPPAPHPAHH